MALLMGIDLGTSGLKVAVFDKNGHTLATGSSDYLFDVPEIGYAEQDPDVWWQATVNAVKGVLQKVQSEDILAVGLSGQMHGLVALDGENRVVRKAILHCDQRSLKQANQMREMLKDEGFSRITYNPAFSGFQLISLAWVRDNEPKNYQRIKNVVCPKDYIRYKLCGEVGVEITDASATLAYDIENECWAVDLIKQLGLDESVFPKEIHRPNDVAGTVTQEAAQLLGLKAGTKIVYGGGDQPMQLLGTGVYKTGKLTITIGTSAQVVAVTDSAIYNPKMNTHTFMTALPEKWLCMGAVLNGGLTLNWFRRTFMPDKSYDQISKLASLVDACSDGLVFFPCLAGERTPYIDSTTRGIFLGMSYLHSAKHFARAVMEGVTFAIKSSVDTLKSLGCGDETIIASGGAAKSSEWLQMQADIYGRELHLTKTVEQTVTGAAIVAGVGCGLFRDIEQGCKQMVKMSDRVIEPDLKRHEIYTEFYHDVFMKIYENNKNAFRTLYNIKENQR